MMVEDCANAFIDKMEQMMSAEPLQPLVSLMQPRVRDAYEACSDLAYKRIYCARDVVDVDLAGNRIINYLLDVLMESVFHPEKNYSQLLLLRMPGQYDFNSENIYHRVQAVVDHISGMTDVYALDLFRKLNGHSLPAV